MSDQFQEQGSEDVTQQMEEVMDKLKLIDYEKQFVQAKNMKPINKAYFAIQTNPTEQFNYFKNLVKWLFQMNECQTQDFNKFEDPLTLAQNIINELKKLQIECNFAPIKLKPGSGEQVVFVLLKLATRALEVKKFQYKKPKFEMPTQTNEEEPVQEAGSVSSDSDPEIASEEEPEDNNETAFNQKNEDKAVIESKIDPKEWILECERAASKLKIQIKHDPREWRGHFEQTKQHAENIKKVLPESRNHLEKLTENLTSLLERIQKREDNINSNLNEKGIEYKRRNEEYKKIEAQYKNQTNSIKEMGEQYRQLTEKYETIQNKLNEHGNTATDSSPVVKIKAALTKLRLEIKQMDLRIGVLSHTVLSHTFMEKKWTAEKDHGNQNGMIFEENDDLSDS